MIETMPICYCYKVIHSFYYNFYNENRYDEIKNVVLNLKEPNNVFEEEVKEFQKIILLLFAESKLTYEEYERAYCFTNKNANVDAIKNITNLLNGHDVFDCCVIMNRIIKGYNKIDAFYIYIAVLKKLSEFFKYHFIIPIIYFEETRDLKNDVVRKFFIKGWFQQIANSRENDNKSLFSSIIDFYKNKKETLNNVKHLYLFGSIPKGNYHKESDIDMVVEFKTINSFEDSRATFDKIRDINKEKFNLDTDIYEIDEFKETNSTLELTMVF